MELAEHILLLLCFIGLVAQTVRASYLSTNKDFYKNRTEHLETANEFLRDRHDKDKSSVSSSNNREESLIKRINEQDQETEKLHKEINWFKTENEAVTQKIFKINSQNVLLSIRNNKLQDTLELERCKVKELESLIAATSLKKVKPLNTALDEMNHTADKWSNYHKQMNQISNKKSVNTDNHLRENLIDEDEDQYNTTAEDNEDLLGAKDMEKYSKPNESYEDWRKKQKSRYKKLPLDESTERKE